MPLQRGVRPLVSLSQTLYTPAMHHPPNQPPNHPNATPTPCNGGLPVVNMLRAKTPLSRLVQAVESGAVAEILIARHGHPVARLTALKGPSTGLRFGLANGG